VLRIIIRLLEVSGFVRVCPGVSGTVHLSVGQDFVLCRFEHFVSCCATTIYGILLDKFCALWHTLGAGKNPALA